MLSSVRRPVPQVTGISPKEGPPGTRVTIRGQDLGLDPRDLIALRICGVDCLLTAEWKSANKIVARTGQAKGKGDIVVVTRSGGVGTSTVQFRGYNVQIGPLHESAVWIDETQTYHTMFTRNRASSPVVTEENDDPLGISDESNDKKFPEDQLQEMFPEGSGNIALENFVAAWYLLDNHHGTSFDDLKAGLAYLKRKSNQQSEGPMSFVKANLSTFMDCYDTLSGMHAKMAEDNSGRGTKSVTQTLEDTLNDANKTATTLFHDVLGRKDSADATRNALGVLHRFKFLFNLPCSMDRNIKKGDYDLVITDYTRAKSLFGDTDIGIFKKVYQEVENRIEAFRGMLDKKLMTLPSTVEEQKKIIRFLLHLEVKGDPSWDCLLNIHKWHLELIQNCSKEHIEKEEASEREQNSANSLSPTLGGPQVSLTPSFKTGSRAPIRILFLENLTRLFCENLPDLWRLGTAYLSGKIAKGVKKSTRLDGSKHTQFKQMVQDVVQYYCNAVRSAFLPDSLENLPAEIRLAAGQWGSADPKKDSPVSWLPLCVRHIRACMQSISLLELPPDSVALLQDLSFDLRWNCMSTLLKQAIEDIKNLHQRETWNVDTDDERGGTTLLPTLYENLVFETVQHLQEVIHPRLGENALFSQTQIEKEAVMLCTELLQSFAGTMEQLAVVGNMERQTKNRRSAISPDLFAPSGGDTMPSLDKRLLIMMSNCEQTREHILPRLIDTLTRHGYPEVESVHEGAEFCYDSLDERLFDNYIEEKANPIMGALEQHMYAGKLDWTRCPKPADVRSYVKEASMGLIEVHAEVYAINPHFVSRVMCRIVEATTDEISRLLQCVPKYSHQGALQARLDLAAFQATIGVYTNEGTREAIAEALDYLPPMTDSKDVRNLEDLLQRFKNRMTFQLMCFSNEVS